MTADLEATARAAREALEMTAVLWIEPGDTERAERYAPLCLPAKAAEHRRVALKGADRLLGELLRDPRVQDLWLLTPRLEARPGLAPFFWMRRGFGPGLLRSPSSHMTGVITAPDLAATLAHVLNAPYTGSGRPVEVTPAPALPGTDPPLIRLQRLGALAEQTDRLRAVGNRVVQWLLLLLAGTGIFALRAGRCLPEVLALLPLLLPTLLLAEGARRGGEGWLAAVLLLLAVAGLAWAYAPQRRKGHRDEAQIPNADGAQRWVAAAAAACIACGLAVLFGDALRWAVLGHSIRLGVRFYGVGNEYIGWWVGAALLAVGIPMEGRPRPWAIWLLLAVALLVGHPAAGANIGGGITALAAAAVEAWPALRARRALAAAALLLAAAALIGLAAWDASRPQEVQTHLGRLAARVAAEGPGPFLSLAGGKLLTNLRLSLTPWGLLLAAGLWPILEARRRAPKAAATGAVSRLLPVAAVAFLANDSGVIAAALMLSYGIVAARGWASRKDDVNSQGWTG